MKNFQSLLSTNTLNMKNNSANGKTLQVLVNRIYETDLAALQAQLPKDGDNCDDAETYLELYAQFK